MEKRLMSDESAKEENARPVVDRWYDDYESIHGAVDDMLKVSDDFQTLVSAGLNVMAETTRDAEGAVKTLGTEKVLALYKSREKKRAYDKNAQFHKTMNYLFALPEEHRVELGQQFQDIAATVREYSKNCVRLNRSPSVDDVKDMVHLFVKSNGSKEVLEAYVDKKYPEFKDAALAESMAKAAFEKQKENLEGETAGLHLRRS